MHIFMCLDDSIFIAVAPTARLASPPQKRLSDQFPVRVCLCKVRDDIYV